MELLELIAAGLLALFLLWVLATAIWVLATAIAGPPNKG